MITTDDLLFIGFIETFSPYSGKMILGIGNELGSLSCPIPIIYFYLETQSCHCIRSEFSHISRKCNTQEEIIQFIKSIKFLFKITDAELPFNH